MNKNQHIGLKGRMRVAVMQNGVEVSSGGWRSNLLLDQGMNKLPDVLICDLFQYAAKGTGTTSNTETVTGTYTLVASSGLLTRNTGARDFTTGDIGKIVRITTTPFTEGVIRGFTSTTVVTLEAVGQGSLADYSTKSIKLFDVGRIGLDAETGDRATEYSAVSGENGTVDASNVRTVTRTFVFPEEPENKTVVSGSYTWSGTSVTQASGRDFSAADIGSYIKFAGDTDYCIITALTDATAGATVVSVDRSGTASGSIDLYGLNTYGEIGLSDIETAGDNINIRVRLEDGAGASDPISLMGSNPETAGQQLKATYEMAITILPAASTAATAPITDTTPAVMSVNKNGDYAIERIALSSIAGNGETDTSLTGLEPSAPAQMAISTLSTALAPFDGPDRSSGAAYTDLENDTYAADSFCITSSGTFGINEAIGTVWRCIGIYDAESHQFLFTFRFDVAQKKDGEHSLTLRFKKTWSRTLA